MDHAGGNDKIKQLVPDIKIYGGSVDKVQGSTNKVEDGDKLSFGDNIVTSYSVPYKRSYKFLCHWQRGRGSCCLTGDTLLAVGSFLNALLSRCINHCVTLSSLPEPTQVYCGHEYSVKKLQFSCEELAVYFDSRTRKCEDLSKIKWAEQKRKEGLPTIPSSIEEELETNPFMCVDLPEVQEKVGVHVCKG